MSKAIKVTAIVAVVMQVVYFLLGRFGIPVGSFFLFSNSYYSSREGLLVYLIYAFFSGIIMVFVYVVFMILLINASNSRSENIAPEIVGIVMLAAVIPLLSSAASLGFSYFYNIMSIGTAADFATIAELRNYSAFGSLFSGPSSILLIISLTMSLSRKKFLIPLEYEKGYGVSEEFTGGEGTPDYMSQHEMNQQFK